MRVVRCRLPVEQGDFALIRPADWSGSIAIAGLVGLRLLARIGIGTGPGPAWVKLGTGGGTATSAYSNGGRLSTVTDWSSRESSYTYTATGRAKTVAVPGGMTTTYAYDRAQRLVSVASAVGATTITSHTYTLDSEGNRTALSEFVSGITPQGQSDRFGFSYDGLNRLTSVTTTNPESFTLDGASNITARTGPSATYTIDLENRVTRRRRRRSCGRCRTLWSW